MKTYNYLNLVFILAIGLLLQPPAFAQGSGLSVSQKKGINFLSVKKGVHDNPSISKNEKSILLVVGDSSEMNRSEKLLQERLEEKGYLVQVINDDTEVPDMKMGIDLVIVSKTVNSLNVGSRYKNVDCGWMTWEDNLQMGQLMGFSDNDGSQGTAWHVKNQDWFVKPDAPAALRAGVSGEVQVYTEPDEITYSPDDSPLPESALVVAALYKDDYHKTYYVFEQGAMLGDGTAAAGRRIYFGLYDDTFRLLTGQGLKLFDAAVAWGCTKP